MQTFLKAGYTISDSQDYITEKSISMSFEMCSLNVFIDYILN